MRPRLLLFLAILSSPLLHAQQSPLQFPVSILNGNFEMRPESMKAPRRMRVKMVHIRRTDFSCDTGLDRIAAPEREAYFSGDNLRQDGSVFSYAFNRMGAVSDYDQVFGTDSGLTFYRTAFTGRPRLRQVVRRSPVMDACSGEIHQHTTIERTRYFGWGTSMQRMQTKVRNHPSDTCHALTYAVRNTELTKRMLSHKRIWFSRLQKGEYPHAGVTTATIWKEGRNRRTYRYFTSHSRNINSRGNANCRLRRSMRRAPKTFADIALRRTGWELRMAAQFDTGQITGPDSVSLHVRDSVDTRRTAFYRRKDRKGDDLFYGYVEERFDKKRRPLRRIELGPQDEVRRVLRYQYDSTGRVTGLDVWNLAASGSTYAWNAEVAMEAPRFNRWSFAYDSAGRISCADRYEYYPYRDTSGFGTTATRPLPLRSMNQYSFTYGDKRLMDAFSSQGFILCEAGDPIHFAFRYQLITEYFPARKKRRTAQSASH
jgi:hypothetical protein